MQSGNRVKQQVLVKEKKLILKIIWYGASGRLLWEQKPKTA
jgi:hypothetical protein